MSDKKYATVKEMPAIYPFFSQAALRHLIHTNKQDIRNTTIKIGRKIVFDIGKFDEWLSKQTWEDKK